MRFLKLASALVTLLLTSGVSVAQTNISAKSFTSKTIWTKFVLPTVADCPVQITAADISPSERSCKFYAHLEPGSKVSVVKISRRGAWLRLSLKYGQDAFSVYLDNHSPKVLAASFNLAFSRRALSEPYFSECKLKTKRDVIRFIGFPSSITRHGGTELWRFDIGYVLGTVCGFDASTITIKRGKVITIGGIV